MKIAFYKSTGERRENYLAQPPVGTVVAYASPGSVPAGWVLCNGASLLTADYPNLFAVIGYTYGGSGGSFVVPDFRGRVPIGVGQGSGNGASGTGVVSGTSLTNRTIAQTGGAETVALTASESGLRAHGSSAFAHGISESNHTHTNNDTGFHTHSNRYNNVSAYKGGGTALAYLSQFGGYSYNSTGPQQGKTITATSSTSAISDGSGNANRVGSTSANASQSHDNTQPLIVMRYIIKA